MIIASMLHFSSSASFELWRHSGFDGNMEPHDFVNHMRKKGQLIMGIGHRVKSINNPDMRVVILKEFVKEHFPSTPLLDYALEVEKITTGDSPGPVVPCRTLYWKRYRKLMAYIHMATVTNYVCLYWYMIWTYFLTFIIPLLSQKAQFDPQRWWPHWRSLCGSSAPIWLLHKRRIRWIHRNWSAQRVRIFILV